jgi:hypothetical protein
MNISENKSFCSLKIPETRKTVSYEIDSLPCQLRVNVFPIIVCTILFYDKLSQKCDLIDKLRDFFVNYLLTNMQITMEESKYPYIIPESVFMISSNIG